MAKKNMSSIDAAWLHMEDPTNLMMINGFFQFDGDLDLERVWVTLEQRLLSFRRFKQRVVEPRLPLRPPFWEDDPDFRLDAHLHHIALPEPADDVTLRDLIADLASTPLDFSKPLWQFHIIEGHPDGMLLYCRLHHCIADGIALMQVMLSMCDEEADAPWPEPVQQPRRRRRFLSCVTRPASEALNTTRKVSTAVAGEYLEVLKRPSHIMERSKEARAFAARLGRLTLLPPDPQTIYKGKLGVSKRAAWSNPLELSEVKRVGRMMGGTINDVLLTTVTGALRRYMIQRQDDPEGIEIRAMVPVNLRPPEQTVKLGNYFGLVVLALPVRIKDPLQRLLELKYRMDDLKNSPEALVGFTILMGMGVAPGTIERRGVEFFATKASAVMTNVPGPKEKLYFAGNRIDNLMFWVPQSGRMGLGVSILSYAGTVVLGVITDTGLVPDPESIIDAFYIEFEAMQEKVAEIESQRYHGAVQFDEDQQMGRCKAMTKAGNPCKNRTMAGSAYCYIHAKVVADSSDEAMRAAHSQLIA